VVNVYDLITDAEPERPDIGRFIKEVIHVPDTMRVDDLFKILREEKQHMAVVTDEYGGTDGIVTLEDILEEIFGEIRDEYDQEESMLYKVGPRAFVIDGRMSLEDAAAALGVPMEDEDVETVAGWLMHIAGRIPLQGQVIEHGPFRATVLDGTVSQIAKVRLELAETGDEDKHERKDSNDA
jgi:CBS domain containing-hemolysin-like protein